MTGAFRNSVWSLDYNYDVTTDALFRYGIIGDFPVAGDWDGDSTTEVCVFRSGVFALASSNTPGEEQSLPLPLVRQTIHL